MAKKIKSKDKKISKPTKAVKKITNKSAVVVKKTKILAKKLAPAAKIAKPVAKIEIKKNISKIVDNKAIKKNDDNNDKKSSKIIVEVAKTVKPDSKQQVKTVEKSSAKPVVKAKSKVKKVEKKEDDFDDDLLGDDFGDSEIAEYEDDLKAVEEEDDDLLEDLLDDEDSDEKETEIYLTDSEGRRLCRVRDCDQVANVDGYCRFHYLLLWKKIQIRKSILLDGKLDKYIDDLTSRYPDKFIEMIKKDMKSEKDFLSAIQELEIDESALGDSDATDDDAQSFNDEIRGESNAPIIDDDGDY